MTVGRRPAVKGAPPSFTVRRSRTPPDGRSARWRHPVRWAAIAAAGTLLVTLVYLNLTSSTRSVEHAIPHTYVTGDSQYVRIMSNLLGPGLVEGNRATSLVNGDEVFPAMLEAIRGAERSITFETYIYWSGEVGRQFAEALAERARAGVRVHVLLDWLGAGKMDRAALDLMRDAGVEVVHYRPLRWYNLNRQNNRTHRKILVVDGRIGFTGGIGVADQWLGDARGPEEWRDSHYRFEGPVVAQLQAAFMDNWIETTGVLLDGDDYFPPIAPAGTQRAQAFRSAAGEGATSIRLMYLVAIAAAARSIRIANAYFVPDSLVVAMLVDARRRGVDVEIIVPGPILDAQVVRRASRAMWGPLLEAGVRIYEYQPAMYHTKVMVVDDLWVSVGSTNFDDRSFRLNDEANVNVLDAEFARAEGLVLDRDRARSRRITLEEWRDRPVWERIQARVALLFRSQL